MLALRIWPYGLTQSYKTSLYVEDCSSLIRTLVSLVDVGCQHSDTPPPPTPNTHTPRAGHLKRGQIWMTQE